MNETTAYFLRGRADNPEKLERFVACENVGQWMQKVNCQQVLDKMELHWSLV